MSMMDMVLGQLAGQDLGGLASKVGLTPQQVEMAIHALGRAQPQPGDTAGVAAEHTGLPVDAMQQILGHLGGEGALGGILGALGGGGGGGLGGLAGMGGGRSGV